MSTTEQIISIGIATLTTMLTRFLPFLIFSDEAKTPDFIKKIGTFLPPAILGMLVVYCFKDSITSLTQESLFGLIAGLLTAGCHVWKRNMLLSIMVGTVSYMLLINFF